MDAPKMRETSMVKGNSHALWRSTHSKPHCTASDVRLKVPRFAFPPSRRASRPSFKGQNAPDLGRRGFESFYGLRFLLRSKSTMSEMACLRQSSNLQSAPLVAASRTIARLASFKLRAPQG